MTKKKAQVKNFVTFRRGITPVHSAKMRPKKRDDYASNDEKHDDVRNGLDKTGHCVRNDEVVIVI